MRDTLSAPLVVLPGVAFRAYYGTPPLAADAPALVLGMSADDVRAAWGEPHEREGAVWVYWTDALTLGCVGIRFGVDGRVTDCWEGHRPG